MTIETRDFGSMELDESAVVEFRAPIFGFEALSRFVLLSDDEAGPGLSWLQSLEEADTCFILLDPDEIGLDYRPEFPPETMEALGAGERPIVRVIAVVPRDFHDTTVNLKSPILINPQKQWAAQVILDADYPIRMRLFGEEGEAC